MTLENILEAFHGEEKEIASNPEWRACFNELCQEAIQIGMELLNRNSLPGICNIRRL